jgi:hypothetical protein
MLICVADTPADPVVEAAADCVRPPNATAIIARLDDPTAATTRQARFLRQVPMATPPLIDRPASQPPSRLDQMSSPRSGSGGQERARRGQGVRASAHPSEPPAGRPSSGTCSSCAAADSRHNESDSPTGGGLLDRWLPERRLRGTPGHLGRLPMRPWKARTGLAEVVSLGTWPPSSPRPTSRRSRTTAAARCPRG